MSAGGRTPQGRNAIDRLERQLLRAVLAQLPVGVVVVEVDTETVEILNDRARQFLGEGPSLRELPLLAGLEAGEEAGLERFRWVGEDGVERVLEGSVAPVVGERGTRVAAVAILRDVTQRERRERAEREFVTNAAHELQTPLTAIISAVEVLQGGAKEIRADRDRFLDHVQVESQRLARLARALLVLARVQTGAEPAERVPVLVRPLLDDVALSITPGPGVEVRVRCPVRLAALADRGLLEQALLNVAANAARHTREGSIGLSARRRGDRAVLEVADTGPGMPPGQADKVFDRFHRVEGRARDGFGLGLAIAREAVAALDGTIGLRPRRPHGLVAVIEVPAAR